MVNLDLDIVLYGLLVIIAVLAMWIFRLERRLAHLLRGKHGNDLEDAINSIATDLKSVKQSIIMIAKELESMDARIRRSVTKVSTLRFNPFKAEGGNHSFTTALLNEDGDGVVLSGLYARNETRVYAKPVKKLGSEHELTKEEREVINRPDN